MQFHAIIGGLGSEPTQLAYPTVSINHAGGPAAWARVARAGAIAENRQCLQYVLALCLAVVYWEFPLDYRLLKPVVNSWEKKMALEGLTSSSGFLRRQLGSILGFRRIPEIQFILENIDMFLNS